MKFLIAGFLMPALLACSYNHRLGTKPNGSDPAEPSTLSTANYQLQGTSTFTLESKETGGIYNIAISYPGSYATADKDKTYPVIYVLDGQWQFPLVNTIAGAVNYDGDIPEVLVVGVSWQETGDELMAARPRDLTHSATANSAGSGQAAKFQQFLRYELFPLIEKNYRGGLHRTVTGGSLSSLFAAYTLLSQPDMFDGYVVSSPSIGWDNESINKELTSFPDTSLNKATRFYLCWGSLERAENVEHFAKNLADKKIGNLAVQYAPVMNSGHAGVNAECYTKGLQFVFQKPDIFLKPATLQAIAGTYKNKNNASDVQFTVKDGKLHQIFSDGGSAALSATSENEFYSQGNSTTFKFDPETGGLDLTSYGRRWEFSKR